jgi:hypothetical protein
MFKCIFNMLNFMFEWPCIFISKQRRDQLDATNSDLLVISCSSTCFGRLYAHHQEVRLHFTAYGFLSCCSCCDAGESGGKMCALWGGSCHPTLQHHNSYKRTENHRLWNAVWPPDDGRKDGWNMLRKNWLPINHYCCIWLVSPLFTYYIKF